MQHRFLFSFLLFLCCVLLVSRAEEGQAPEDSDLLEELDEIDLSAEERSSLLGQLAENYRGKSILRYDFYPQDIEVGASPPLDPDRQKHFFQQRHEFDTFTAAGPLRLDLAGWIQFGNQEQAYHSRLEEIDGFTWEDFLQDRSATRNYFQISELYLSLFTPRLDVSIGKKVLVNTVSSLYRPGDLYHVQDLYDPLDVKKLGRLLLQLDLKLGDLALTGVVFPFFQGDKLNPRSRWGYDAVVEALSNFQQPLSEANYPAVSLENVSYLLRLKGPLWGVDTLLSFFHGLEGNMVSRITGPLPTDKVTEVVPVFQSALGLATTAGKLELHGEALLNHTYGSKDEDYLDYVAGFVFTVDDWLRGSFIDRIELGMEYAGEWLIRGQSHPDYTDSSADSRPLKNDVLQHLLVQWSEKLSTELAFQLELDAAGLIFACLVEYQPGPNLELGLGFQVFRVPEQSDYAEWQDNGRVFLTTAYSY